MWNIITYDDFRKLILNYHNIDFNKNQALIFNYPGDPIAVSVFEFGIKAYFIHYHQKNDVRGVEKRSVDVFSNNILDYTKEKLKKRVSRMDGEDPLFIFETRPRKRFGADYNEKDVEDFININSPYTRIVITSFEKYKNYPEKIGNCYIMYYDDKHPNLPPDTEDMAKKVYEKFNHLFHI